MRKVYFGIFVAVIFLLEVSLRIFAGAGQPILFEADPNFAYFPKPNQSVRRLGRRIVHNRFGMRSGGIDWPRKRGDTQTRILCVGDSVTNGDTRVDQFDTYPYVLGLFLRRQFGGDNVEIFNASAGGWGLENMMAYLEKRGIYGADWVVLQFGTDDFTQSKMGPEVVGTTPFFPNENSVCGICELYRRYVAPRIFGYDFSMMEKSPYSRQEQVERNFAAIEKSLSLIRNKKAKVVVLLTFNREEALKNTETSELRTRARTLLDKMNVDYVDLLESFRSQKLDADRYFFDFVHPNAEGNRFIAEELDRYFRKNGLQN